MSILKKLASDSAIYGLSSIFGRSIYFLLVYVHTNAFADNLGQMGVSNLLFSLVAVINVVYTYGMETAFFRFANSSHEDSRKVYNTAQSGILLSSIILSLLIILFSKTIIYWLGYPGQEHLLVWFAVILALDAIVAIPFARLRQEGKAKKYVAIRISSVLLNVLLNLFFLWYAKGVYDGKIASNFSSIITKFYNPALGVGYIVMANLIANLLYVPLLWRELVDKFHFKIDPILFKKMWQYGYPLLILGLAGMVNQNIDRSMLKALWPTGLFNNMSADEAIGIYGSCYKLSVLIALATQSFRFAADPFFFSKVEDKNAPAVFAKVTKWFTIVCCIIALAICLNIDIIGLFINVNYRSGLGIVPYLVFGQIFLGIYYNLAVWFKLSDRTYFGTYITIFGAVLNVALNYILIPKFGFMGCAWAFVISCAAMTALCYVLGAKYYPVPYDLVKICSYLAGSALLIFISAQFNFPNQLMATGIHFMLLGTAIGTVYLVEK